MYFEKSRTLGNECNKRKSGRPVKNWNDTLRQNMKIIGMAWENAKDFTVNREYRDAWRDCVAQCLLDAE